MHFLGEDEDLDLIIVGMGVKRLQQMTLESYWACQEADVILGTIVDSATREIFAREFDADLYDVGDFYDRTDKEVRFSAYYYNILGTLEEAWENDDLVVMIGGGHPNYWNFTTTLTQTLAENHWDLNVRTLPGVSSFAATLSHFSVNPSFNDGIQIYSLPVATHYNTELNPAFDAFFMSFGHIEAFDQNDVEAMGSYLAYLGQYYEKDKDVYLTRISKYPGMKSAVHETTLEGLSQYKPSNHGGYSLYIPTGNLDNSNGVAHLNNQRNWNAEELENLKSPGTGRAKNTLMEPYEPQSEAEAADMRFFHDFYTDKDFHIFACKNPYEAMDEYGVSERFRSMIEKAINAGSYRDSSFREITDHYRND